MNRFLFPFICASLLVSFSVCRAENERVNIFLTEEEERFYRDQGDALAANLSLSAVFYSPEGESRAVIDGKVMKKGDHIENKEIIEIKPESVFLRDTKNLYYIKLKQILTNGNETNATEKDR